MGCRASIEYQAIDALLTACLRVVSMRIFSMQGHPDSVLVFLAISAYMAIFMLCETIEARSLSAEEAPEAVLVHKQRPLNAARELGMLLDVLGRLNRFEVSLFSAAPSSSPSYLPE